MLSVFTENVVESSVVDEHSILNQSDEKDDFNCPSDKETEPDDVKQDSLSSRDSRSCNGSNDGSSNLARHEAANDSMEHYSGNNFQ